MAKITHYKTIVLDAVKAGAKPVIVKMCIHCGGHTTFLGDPERLQVWRNGQLVQNVYPNLNKGDRETLISGVHSECWDKVFKPSKRSATFTPIVTLLLEDDDVVGVEWDWSDSFQGSTTVVDGTIEESSEDDEAEWLMDSLIAKNKENLEWV